MGALGWSPTEIDGWPLWLIGSFMGEDDLPVMKGSRMIDHPRDKGDPRTRRARDRKRPVSAARGMSAADRARVHQAREKDE